MECGMCGAYIPDEGPGLVKCPRCGGIYNWTLQGQEVKITPPLWGRFVVDMSVLDKATIREISAIWRDADRFTSQGLFPDQIKEHQDGGRPVTLYGPADSRLRLLRLLPNAVAAIGEFIEMEWEEIDQVRSRRNAWKKS